jgi:photosystem II stability/assembly factor-like uncharacterized protein
MTMDSLARFITILSVANVLLACSPPTKPSRPRQPSLSAASLCAASPQEDSGFFLPLATKLPTHRGEWIVDPQDPLTFYVLGDPVMRSNDAGKSWCPLSWPGNSRTLLFAQRHSPALYLVAPRQTPDRLFKSTDQGQSWSDVGSVESSFAIGEVVLIDADDGPVFLKNRSNAKLARSTNDGATWNEVDPAPQVEPFSAHNKNLLVTKGASPVVFLQSAFSIKGKSGPIHHVLVSVDAGMTFVQRELPDVTQPASLTWDFEKNFTLSVDCGGRLYFSDRQQMFRSIDNAEHWESIRDPSTLAPMFRSAANQSADCAEAVYGSSLVNGLPMWIRLDNDLNTFGRLPSDGSLFDLGEDRLLFVSSTTGLRHRSDDAGRSWWLTGVSLGGSGLIPSPARQDRFFALSSGNVFRSDDRGESWQGIPSSPTRMLHSLVPDTSDPELVYGTGRSTIDDCQSFVSKDGGLSFANWPVPSAENPERVLSFVPSSTDPRTVTVVTLNGVYETHDSGAHFARLLKLPQNKSISGFGVGTGQPLAIYLFVKEEIRFPSQWVGSEYWISLDGGVTWDTRREDSEFAMNVLVIPGQPQQAYSFRYDKQTTDMTMIKTVDAGKSWSPVPNVPRELKSPHVSIDPLPPHALYAVSGLTEIIYKADSDGGSWRELSRLPFGAVGLVLDPHPGGVRYAVSNGNVYRMVERD